MTNPIIHSFLTGWTMILASDYSAGVSAININETGFNLVMYNRA